MASCGMCSTSASPWGCCVDRGGSYRRAWTHDRRLLPSRGSRDARRRRVDGDCVRHGARRLDVWRDLRRDRLLPGGISQWPPVECAQHRHRRGAAASTGADRTGEPGRMTDAFFAPEEAGMRVGAVLMATVFGMALGGWMSGVIFDVTGSYQAAFLNGLLWNVLNIGIAVGLLRRPGRIVPASLDA